MSNQEPLSPQPQPEFDQIVKGNVCIKKLSKHKYRITFSKIGKFLVYQVWDKDNVGDQNSKRRVFNLLAKTWINDFIQQNRDLEESGKPLFTPTTIIETVDEEQYACVIHKAYFNSDDRVVFTISTKEIQLANNCSKKLIKIPCGKFYNMRFDIDAAQNVYGIVYNREGQFRDGKRICPFPQYSKAAYGGLMPAVGCDYWLYPAGSVEANKVGDIIHNSKGPGGEAPGDYNWTYYEIIDRMK